MSHQVYNPYHDRYLSHLIKNLCSHLQLLVLTHHAHCMDEDCGLYGQPLLRTAEQPLRPVWSEPFTAWLSWASVISAASSTRALIAPPLHSSLLWIYGSYKPVYSVHHPSALCFSVQNKCQILRGPAQSAVPSLLLKLSRPFRFIGLTHRPLVYSLHYMPLVWPAWTIP